jgi:hypothetical protein
VAGTSRWSALRDGIKRDQRRPVVVTSPHPPDECLRRLAKVTTYRRDRWYSDWRTATLPDPLFQGELWPSGLRLALFTANMARGYGAWFEARIDPAPEGGTTLTGTVGWPGVWAGPVVGLVALVIWIGVAVVITASGHLIPGVGVAIALAVFVLMAILAARARQPGPGTERKEAPIPGLLRVINGVLDSTSEFPG